MIKIKGLSDGEGEYCSFYLLNKSVGLKLYPTLTKSQVDIIRRRQIIAYNNGLAPKVRSKLIAVNVGDERRRIMKYGYLTNLAIILPRYGMKRNQNLMFHDINKKEQLFRKLRILFSNLIGYVFIDGHDENYGIDKKTGKIVFIDFDFAGTFA